MTPIEDRTGKMPVLAAGKGWLVVDKPAGMTVHNAPGQDVCSLIFRHIRNEPFVSERIGMDPDFGVNPVHRLDRETSGILLLAATPERFRFLSKQFQSRQVIKRYIAILHGALKHPQGNDSWQTWRWALSKTAGGRFRPEGTGRLQSAVTRYRILDGSKHYTLVEIDLLSGRKHQIRRHARLSGHPVAGDVRYGSKRAAAFLKSRYDFDRLALHARSLTFQPPDRTAPETVSTPAIPEQLLNLLTSEQANPHP